MMDFGYWGGLGILGSVLMMLWWVLIIVGIVALVKWIGGIASPGRGMREKSALEILKERYAKGEVDKREFDAKKKDLEAV